MKFCPKCGGVMLPKREGDKTLLVCNSCGYKMEPKPEDLKRYKGVEKVKDHVLTTKTVNVVRRRSRDKEEIEQAREEYYELVLDQLGEYGD
ncbi:MAG: transcription elongation factor [Aeropyrum sp.]|nr:transcription elongation factor [Aeropyrum sp.]MCE4616106.1 transcription elongation factor [Aeropyrum sp.]